MISGQQMLDLDTCYRVLELEPGATLEEVNRAYRDLVFIWHPDRIPKDNTRLIEKAQEKIKQFNEARDQLRQHIARYSSQTCQRGANQRQSYRSSPPPRSPSNPYTYRSYHATREQQTAQYAYSQPYNHCHSKRTAAPPRTTPPHKDMSGVNLQGANLSEKDFEGHNLSHANLSYADLSDAFLHRVILHRANLRHANLFRANLLQADLSYADLQEANLIGADLSGADLRGADLRGAKMSQGNRLLVKLTGARLTGAIMPDGHVHT
ncbi:pentapeptide repeat-containing protein [Thermosynechococcus sp. Uc]|uniref:pentapeptide repeat-containing protein n=1 Tax=Thermosynechococcus sp. Uc TaxID=3034853 RepID=UPI0026132ED8|nr:pentapeptide repeat-containing protein [Thermosynechococcus sp. Uc]